MKKKSQALANCFSNSILLSHISKVDLSKYQKPEEKKFVEPIKYSKPEEKKFVEPIKYSKPEEKKFVEPIKIRKPVDLELSTTPSPSQGLKLKINLKNASVTKQKVVEQIPLQQPILGKLVVRKDKKVPTSKSILFPPVTSSCRDDLDKQEKDDERRKSKKKSKKEKRAEKNESEEQAKVVESETRKVPKLVIKRDVLVPTPKSSRKKKENSESVSFPLSSPSTVKSVDESFPVEVLSSPPKSIKILPLKITAKQTSEVSVRPGPKSSERKRPRLVEVLPEVEPEREKVIVRTVSRSNSAGSTDSSRSDTSNRRLDQKCSVTLENIEIEKLSSADCHDESGVVVEMASTDLKLLTKPKSSKKAKQKNVFVPKLRIKLGPSTSQSPPESGKQLSAILTDLAKNSTQIYPESVFTSCKNATKSFDEILKEKSEEKSSNIVDEFEHTCVVQATNIGNALNVLLSMEVEKEIVGKILDDLILLAVSQIDEKVSIQDDRNLEVDESEVDDPQSLELRISDGEEADFEPETEECENKTDNVQEEEVCSISAKHENELNRDQVKPSLKVTLTRKENHFVASSFEEIEEVEKSEFAVIRVPSTSTRAKPKRAGSGLSGSDYTRRRGKGGRRKLDKLIIKNVSRLTAVAASEVKQREEEGEGETAADVVIANESERICDAIVQQLFDSIFKEAVVVPAVADVVVEERKVPPLKIKSSQIKIKKHHKSRREESGGQLSLIVNNKTIVKEEDVFYKKVVPPLKLILGSAKNPEIVKEKPVVRTLKVTLSKIDLDPILLETTKTSEEVSESPKEEKIEKRSKPMPKSRLLIQNFAKSTETPKRKLSDETEEIQRSKKLKAGERKNSTAEEKSSLATDIIERPHLKVTLRGKKADLIDSQSQERPTASSQERPTASSRRSLSIKGSEEDLLRSETSANLKSSDNIVELLSSRRRYPSAQIEKTSVDDSKKKKSFPNVEPETNRRYSLHSIDAKLKNVSSVGLSKNAIKNSRNVAQPVAKPLLVANPPFFARKSAPKIVQPEDQEPVRIPIPIPAKVSTPKLQKPEVARVVHVSPKPVETCRAKPVEKTVEETVVIRKAISQIRQTPDSVHVFSMIDKLFDNVMDIYKFDKPEKAVSELISVGIVEELVDSAVCRTNSVKKSFSKIEENQKMEIVSDAEIAKCDRNDDPTVNEDHSTTEMDSEKTDDNHQSSEKNACPDSEEKVGTDVVHATETALVLQKDEKKSEDVDEEKVCGEVTHQMVKEENILTVETVIKSQEPEIISPPDNVSEDNSAKAETEAEPKQKLKRRSSSTTTSSSNNIEDSGNSEPKIKVRRNTKVKTFSLEIVSAILLDMISGAVFQSETLKPRREDVWESIVATARPTPELVTMSPETRLSSEVETDGEDDSSQFSGGRDLSLRSCLPYQVKLNIFLMLTFDVQIAFFTSLKSF